MGTRNRVGRNDPCPCGSGKKYKRCCGLISEHASEKEWDPFELTGAIAYAGDIGRKRKAFCVDYTRRKQEEFQNIREAQVNSSKSRGELISCGQGCSLCCLSCMEANVQECEAIVFYLYGHPDVLCRFLKKYPLWREHIREKGDLWKDFGQLGRQALSCDKETAERMVKAYAEEDQRYRLQRISCPFLENDLCSIYEVRPYVCATLFATTPRRFCDPSSAEPPLLGKDVSIIKELFDVSFWHHGPLQQPVQAFMPVMVYEILKSGTYYFTKIPGLEVLDEEFMSDPEVKAILRRFAH